MTTLENTISMMEKLPEADLVKIQNLTKKLFHQHEYELIDHAVSKTLKRMSKKDFLEDIAMAEKDIANGRYEEASGVFDELEQKYGL